ncbi:aspartic peptidase domain-containing protein [Mycena maculata]|uniref:Aspartic peptidase domain-containing protein n=1 Tax=Mycena maculata TaxID=230809 RepID=A0AAD7IJX1_9AGAR|nr:aspartic peptidase domain-containing protein [Mycena maculata]
MSNKPSKNANFVLELQEFARNHDHDPYYKGDVAKWRIREPATPCVGIFWNETKGCLEEIFAQPQRELPLPIPCRPISSTVLDLGISSQHHVPVLASTSGQWQTNNTTYGLERRNLSLNDALAGLLHTVDIGTYHEDPAEGVPFSRLAIDTGSVPTWIFGQHPTLLRITDTSLARTDDHLNRTGRQGYYLLGATQNRGETAKVLYLEGSGVRLNLYTGPLYLRAGLKPDGSAFHVCRSPNFIFGVATGATYHFGDRKMDGILGLGFRETNRTDNLQIFVTSLYHEEVIERDHFTVALGQNNQKSYLVIGENTGSAVQVNGVWSPWIPVVESSAHWNIHLESLTIGDDTEPIQLNAILDTGTTYSFFPNVVCQKLDGALGGGQKQPGSSKVLYRRRQRVDKMVDFEFSTGGRIRRCLEDFLDPRLNTFVDVQGEAAAYPAFKPMHISGDKSSSERCILGNFFLRGLIVEFERTNYVSSGGRIRFASRGNDL